MVASNLSLGGLYCTSNDDFPEMTRLAVRLMLPSKNGNTEQVDVQAVVVRRSELQASTGNPRYELALFFTDMGNRARECLARFLS